MISHLIPVDISDDAIIHTTISTMALDYIYKYAYKCTYVDSYAAKVQS